MFEELLIFIFGDTLYNILLADYPVLLAMFVFLSFYTIILCFSYFIKGAFGGFR